MSMTKNEIANLMLAELDRANKVNSPFATRYHGYAIILEELDELWDEIKKKHPDSQRMLEEVVQVGAMAMKFVQLLKGIKEGVKSPSTVEEWKPTSETEAKCKACRYDVMTDEELQKLGYDPCDTCNKLSNWMPKEGFNCD